MAWNEPEYDGAWTVEWQRPVTVPGRRGFPVRFYRYQADDEQRQTEVLARVAAARERAREIVNGHA